MKSILLLTIILFGLNSHSNTKYSDYISDLQNKFGDVQDRKIVYLDRDKINSAYANLKNNSDESKAKVIVKFVEKISNQQLSIPDADTLMRGMHANGLAAYPLLDINKKPICVIVPSNPNFNEIQSNLRLLNWELLSEKKELKNMTVQLTLSKEVLQLASDVHETFHCLDDEFLPNAQVHEVNHEMFHKAEVFAEIGALLYLKKIGYTDINDTRAMYRALGSFLSGKYLANSGFDAGPWGAVYSLQKPINSISNFFEGEISSGWQLKEIINFSKSITKLESLSSHEFYGISLHHKSPEDLQKLIAEKIIIEDFDYLRDRFLVIDKTIKEYDIFLNKSMTKVLTEKLLKPEEFKEIEFNLEIHCPNINYNENTEEVSTEIDQLREQHYSSNKPYKSLAYKQLNNIYNCINYHTRSR